MKTIAVFGATGRTGKPFTGMALNEGFQVKALARTSSRMSVNHPNLQVIQGDALDPTRVEETILGADTVIFLIGPGKGSPPDIKALAIRNILRVMQTKNVRRLLAMASVPFGALDADDRPGFGHKSMLFMARTLMGAMVAGEKQYVNLIRLSDLDWTIIRAPQLSDQPTQGAYHVGHLGVDAGSSVTRGDVAAFILDELKKAKYIRQMPLVSN